MLFQQKSIPINFRSLFFSVPYQSSSSPNRRARVEPLDAQFETFFLQFERQITAYLCRMTGDEQMAYDLCQETFLRAWQNFAQLQDTIAARAWLYRVATNLALRYQERRTIHPQIILEETFPGDSDPGRRIVEKDRVQEILMSLTPKQRSALILHEVHGMSCEEVGDLLHLSRDAVKMALWRGRDRFRSTYLKESEQ
jgi:RNA polymerase sigma-70 factor (ECF subfamily)